MEIVTEYWIVRSCQNLTACDTFNEETFQGSTQRELAIYTFLNQEDAESFYRKQKTMLKFASLAGQYVTSPEHYKMPRVIGGIEVECETFDGVFYKVLCPYKHEVCTRCNGYGMHTRPGIDDNGITESEMDELGQEFQEDYFAGKFDVQCEECKGVRVVKVPDSQYLPTAIREDYKRARDEFESHEAEMEYERRYL